MKEFIRYMVPLLILPVLAACHDGLDDGGAEDDAPVNLTMSVSVPDISVSTKGLEDLDTSGWTQWENIVDGRYFSQATIFLVNETTGDLVAFRDIYYTSTEVDEDNGYVVDGTVKTDAPSGTVVRASFLYDNPKHGNIEKLHRGDYMLIVLCNYSGTMGEVTDSQGNKHEYDGLGGKYDEEGSLRYLVNEIKTSFTKDAGISDFMDGDLYDRLINYKVSAGDDFVCEQTPQPLTLKKHIELHPGDNNISAEVKRTRARIRVEVENNSETDDLKVSSLKFNEVFSQKEAYLIDDPEGILNRADLSETRDAPDPFSENAIVRFNGGTEGDVIIPKLDLTNPDSNTKVIFDAYVLESKVRSESEEYAYTVDLWYEKGDQFYLDSDNVLKSLSDVETTFMNGTTEFALQNRHKEYRFLRNDSNVKVASGKVTAEEVNNSFRNPATPWEYAWELEKSDDPPGYYIKTSGPTQYYMGGPEKGKIELMPSVDSAPVFVLEDNGSGVCMKYETLYVNVNGNNQEYVEGYTGNDGGSTFWLYPLKKGEFPISYHSPIPLETIDPVTSQVRPVKEIRRNDFISVLVTVSYNRHDGSFSFKALPWTVKDGNYIEYN